MLFRHQSSLAWEGLSTLNPATLNPAPAGHPLWLAVDDLETLVQGGLEAEGAIHGLRGGKEEVIQGEKGEEGGSPWVQRFQDL